VGFFSGYIYFIPLSLSLSPLLQIFVDKAAKRAVLSLGVKCVNWKRKCDWTGDLSYVEVRDDSYIFNQQKKSLHFVQFSILLNESQSSDDNNTSFFVSAE